MVWNPWHCCWFSKNYPGWCMTWIPTSASLLSRNNGFPPSPRSSKAVTDGALWGNVESNVLRSRAVCGKGRAHGQYTHLACTDILDLIKASTWNRVLWPGLEQGRERRCKVQKASGQSNTLVGLGRGSSSFSRNVRGVVIDDKKIICEVHWTLKVLYKYYVSNSRGKYGVDRFFFF